MGRFAAGARPILRYHGGKWRLAPWIISHFGPHRIYVEPFAGAASVLLRKPRSECEIVNDLDDEIVNLFRVLRDPDSAARLHDTVRLTPYARTEFFATYDAPATSDPVERARRRVIRAAMAFGTTSGKANRTGFRATPWRSGGQTGVTDWTTWPNAIAGFTERLRGVLIECRPALEIIAQQDSAETLFFVDPPYPVSTRTSVRCQSDAERAYRHDMDDDEHRALAAALRRGEAQVVLSGYPCKLYDEELFPDWKRTSVRARGDGGVDRVEVLWLNRAAQRALQSAKTLFSEETS